MPKPPAPMPSAERIFADGYAEIRALADTGTAELWIYGDIGDNWAAPEASVTAQRVVAELENLKALPLTVRINSYGGVVADALAIHNAIKRHAGATHGIIDGVAASSGSLIAMACDTLAMADNAVLMIHAPWGAAMGNAVDMRGMANTLDTYAEAMATSYVRGKVTAKDALELLTDGEDHYFTAAQALAHGLVDQIAQPAPIAATAQHRIAAALRYRMPRSIAAALVGDTTTTPDPDPTAGSNPGDHPMTDKASPAGTPTATPETQSADVTQIQAAAEVAAVARIAARNKEVQGVFAKFLDRDGMRPIYDAVLADPTVSVEQARAKLLDKLGEGVQPIAGAVHLGLGLDEADKFRAGMTTAILMRVGAVKADGANQFRGLRLSEMARACLRRTGLTGVDSMTAEELAPLALGRTVVRGAGVQTTSDFPVLLEDAMHKLVLMGFQAVPITYDRFCKIGDVSDFRTWSRIVPGMIGNLDGVNEAGEYRDKNIPDGAKNTIQATRKGNIISITPEVLVNDDTGAITDMARGIGAAGPRTIERAVYALIEANPTLSDGVALFHSTHGNLAGSGAAPTVALLDSARVAMAQQTAPGDDAEYLDIRPAVALVATGLDGTMKVLVGAEYDPDTANKLQRPNIARGIVRDIVSSPRLSANPWYLFADPMVAPVIEVVFLNGQREPRLVQEEAFRTGGLSWRVEMPFGVGAIDYRGAYKNGGGS